MEAASLAEMKGRLSAFVDSSRSDGPVVITRNGEAVAVLIAPRDEADLETLALRRSPRFLDRLERARQSIRQGIGLDEAEF